jgi:hypothetical protein
MDGDSAAFGQGYLLLFLLYTLAPAVVIVALLALCAYAINFCWELRTEKKRFVMELPPEDSVPYFQSKRRSSAIEQPETTNTECHIGFNGD